MKVVGVPLLETLGTFPGYDAVQLSVVDDAETVCQQLMVLEIGDDASCVILMVMIFDVSERGPSPPIPFFGAVS